jgi:hypothetical protein
MRFQLFQQRLEGKKQICKIVSEVSRTVLFLNFTITTVITVTLKTGHFYQPQQYWPQNFIILFI